MIKLKPINSFNSDDNLRQFTIVLMAYSFNSPKGKSTKHYLFFRTRQIQFYTYSYSILGEGEDLKKSKENSEETELPSVQTDAYALISLAKFVKSLNF